MKKIIAREFLLTLSAIISTLILAFVSVKISNSNSKKKIELEEKIINLTTIKKLPYRLKIYYFLKKEGCLNSNKRYVKREFFIQEMKNTKIASKIFYDFVYDNLNKKKYFKKNSNKSEKWLIENARTKFLNQTKKDEKSENYLLELKILEDDLVQIKKSIFKNTNYKETGFVCSIIVFSIFFLLRYLFYAIKWSIKQLN